MRIITVLITTFALSLFAKPAFTENLEGSSWDNYGYHLGYYHHKAKPIKPPDGVPYGHEDEYQIKDWLLTYRDNILANSTSEGRDLNHKSVSFSLTLGTRGEIKNLKIDQSSGLEAIDKKAETLILNADVRKIKPPPNRLPFYRGLLISFADDPFVTVNVRPQGK